MVNSTAQVMPKRKLKVFRVSNSLLRCATAMPSKNRKKSLNSCKSKSSLLKTKKCCLTEKRISLSLLTSWQMSCQAFRSPSLEYPWLGKHRLWIRLHSWSLRAWWSSPQWTLLCLPWKSCKDSSNYQTLRSRKGHKASFTHQWLPSSRTLQNSRSWTAKSLKTNTRVTATLVKWEFQSQAACLMKSAN